ncbi:MAG TPA: hypothetical protein K8V90_05805 [Romboutsia timonensis]|uniref:Uncharacterized protein n=1 Tax=Romboutsia timonensis TaxID=1776391 RepID=A0A921N0K7_9FIRM|nr:hypothetical protein [Romboutsia timonensis]
MLRLTGRNRNKRLKHNNSKQNKKNIQEKSNYEEDYNEIILNDLVPQEHQEEYGLDNESNPKKQGGLKLNFALNSKKRPNKKQHNNQNDKDTSEILEDIQDNKQQIQEHSIETINTKKISRPKRRPNHKKELNHNQEIQGNENLKSNKSKSKNEHNHKEKLEDTKSSQSEKNQGKSSHGKQANHKNESEKSSKKSNGKLKKSANNKKSTNASQEKTKNSNQKVTNPKKRKRPHVHNEELEDEVRNLEEVEPKVDIEVKEDDDQDIITFRGEENIEEDNNQNECQLKASEIKEVQSRFENIVWSEDKFPKK